MRDVDRPIVKCRLFGAPLRGANPPGCGRWADSGGYFHGRHLIVPMDEGHDHGHDHDHDPAEEGHHTFPAENADRLEDAAARYRRVSAEELCWALGLPTDGTVLDVGSGTGFYVDDVAPHAGRVVGLDVQPAMHAYYREKGAPGNVHLVAGSGAEFPLRGASIDAAYTTMTYHELPRKATLSELARALVDGGRFVVADWSADGAGESGPPLDERFTAADAAARLREADFSVVHEAVRPETFLVVGERDPRE
jgi:SAM-dependent methyltransferase